MATPTVAANAYASLARITDQAGGFAKAAGANGEAGESFGSMLKNAIGAVAQSGQQADAQTQAMAAGKANVVDVVTAVAETETAVQAVVAIRDRVIQAYEEIMRMPI